MMAHTRASSTGESAALSGSTDYAAAERMRQQSIRRITLGEANERNRKSKIVTRGRLNNDKYYAAFPFSTRDQ